jgi:hypothetical protein
VTSVTITGASDDTVLVSGDISAEFLVYDDNGEQGVLVFDGGLRLRVHLDGETWRISVVNVGEGRDVITVLHPPVPGLDRDYTAQATVSGPFTHITCRNDGGRGPATVYAAGQGPE